MLTRFQRKVKAFNGAFQEQVSVLIHGRGTLNGVILNYPISQSTVSEYSKPRKSRPVFDKICENFPEQKTGNDYCNVEQDRGFVS